MRFACLAVRASLLRTNKKARELRTIFKLAVALLVLLTACSQNTTAPTTTAVPSAAPATTTAPSTTAATVTTTAETTTTSPTTTTSAPTTTAATTTTEAEEPSLRIVSMSPTATEILFAIGAGDMVVAADQFSDYPANAPTTDLDGFSPNVEAIVAYEPDIVFLQAAGELGPALELLDIEVVVQSAAMGLEDVYAQIIQSGEVVGREEEAVNLVIEMLTEIDALVESAGSASGQTYFHELDPSLYSATSSTFIGAVYGLFDIENVADAADADGSSFGYPQLSNEYLIDVDPDLIFLADTVCCGQNAAALAERPGWNDLSAVANGKVIELDDSIASRWGPRVVDFVAAIAKALEQP